METTVNQRIAEIIDKFGYKSRRSFSEKIGIAQTSFNDILKGAEPKYSTLNKILLAEPLVSPGWLLTGEGKMMKDENMPIDDSNTVSMSREVFDRINKLTETIIDQQKTINLLQSEKEKLLAQLGDRAISAVASE
jgi:SMC interacting uncharacterized protein involved in chromosome segregation